MIDGRSLSGKDLLCTQCHPIFLYVFWLKGLIYDEIWPSGSNFQYEAPQSLIMDKNVLMVTGNMSWISQLNYREGNTLEELEGNIIANQKLSVQLICVVDKISGVNQPNYPWSVTFWHQPKWLTSLQCLCQGTCYCTSSDRQEKLAHKVCTSPRSPGSLPWLRGAASPHFTVWPHLHSVNNLPVLAECTGQWAGRKTHPLRIHPCRCTWKV